MKCNRKAHIVGIGSYVPERILSNADLEKMVDTNDEWIMTRTGVRQRRIAREDEFSSDMGVRAARKALETSSIPPDQIDMVIVSTSTPDYLFPCTAGLIQKELGLNGVPIFDFQAACTGFIYGLSLVKAFIETGANKNILLVATEKLSSFVDYTERGTCILFGDGAAAVVISAQPSQAGFEIETVKLGGEGFAPEAVFLPGGACRCPATPASVAQGLHYIKMEGREVFKHAVRRMAQSCEETMKELSLTHADIQWLIPHQANVRIIEGVAKRLDFPMERIFLTVEKYGNTSASSVPIALHDLAQQCSIQQGERLLLTSFGAGFTWGSAIIRKQGDKRWQL